MRFLSNILYKAYIGFIYLEAKRNAIIGAISKATAQSHVADLTALISSVGSLIFKDVIKMPKGVFT